MGNSNQKNPLRKAQSVPESQFLQETNPDFVRSKTRASARLNRGKSHEQLETDVSVPDKPKWNNVPLVEALFLPDFPVRGDFTKQEFVIVDVIAKGTFGNVYLVRREDEKQNYAVKVLGKTQIIVENAIQQCKDEAAIQAMLGDHPFIVKLHEYWQSRKHLYIVLDYVPYGDMFTLWTFHGFFPEPLVRIYIAQLALVLDFLHNSGVIYRDLKMENILFDQAGNVQLTDFGLSKWLTKGEKTRTICGTLQYMAPEVLVSHPYGHTADWWSLGILMFVLLAGKYPAEGAVDHMEMTKLVWECDYLLPNHCSDAAQEVVNKLLIKSPEKRMTDLSVFQSLSFYKGLNFTAVIEKKIFPKSTVPDDFFPMSGVSYSYAPNPDPNSVPHMNGKDPFAGFDFVWNLPPDAEEAVFV